MHSKSVLHEICAFLYLPSVSYFLFVWEEIEELKHVCNTLEDLTDISKQINKNLNMKNKSSTFLFLGNIKHESSCLFQCLILGGRELK